MVARDGSKRSGHNRVAVVIDVCWTLTQGSSCLLPSLCYGAARATLGFGTESRWDSPCYVAAKSTFGTSLTDGGTLKKSPSDLKLNILATRLLGNVSHLLR